MKKTKKSAKPEKVTFEAVAHFLPEGYFEQYSNMEINDEIREEFEKRIRKANRPVGVKTAAVLDKRSRGFQDLYVRLKQLTPEQAERFELLCLEVTKAKNIVGVDARESAFAKIAQKYSEFVYPKLLIPFRAGYKGDGPVYDCEIPGMSFALDTVRSLKSYYSYSELL